MRSARRLQTVGAVGATLLLVVVGSSAGARPTAAPAPHVGSGTGGVQLTDLGDFTSPVYVATAPGRKNRDLLFVVEQGGTVQVIRNGQVLDQPFLDISDRISSGGERGLLSIAFDPGYAKNRRLYAYYTGVDGDVRVSVLRRSTDSNVRADPDSMRKVIAIPHPVNANHNGGEVTIGPDGNLWMATGDGGSSCDPPENAQNKDVLLGKMLRITPGKHGGYSIPKDNPFVKRPGADEIYAYGLRNPFRFSFDEGTGTIAIGDVGQSTAEEIDYLKVKAARGANFGWDAYEGDEPLVCAGEDLTPLPPNPVFPIHEYGHSGGDFSGCAITGGLVVRDRRLKTLYGRYIYSDVCNGQLRSLVPMLGGASGDGPVGPTIDQPTSFTAGRGEKVYVTSLAGHVYRLDPATGAGTRTGPAARRAPGGKPQVDRGHGHGGFRLATLGKFDSPTYVTGPKGANGLLFVVEQDGVIRTVKNGQTQHHPFLDIRKQVLAGDEQGLLSVAFSPQYGHNRLFYVYYTDHKGDIVVKEFRRSKHNPADAREDSGRTVIKIRHREAPNHNGGQLQFGPDGGLYLGTGDGGSEYDPPENAQNKNVLLGKLLRIDPRRHGHKPYSIPKSNPFVGKPGRNEIYSYGLRNPFRFSFDRKSGRLVIGDVGQDLYEEVDYETRSSARGANFGWDALEGNHRVGTDPSPLPHNPESPIFEYSHKHGGCAIIGGYVSRDKRIPSLSGRYLYGDLCTGEIRSLVPGLGHAKGDRGTGLDDQPGISSFGEDSHGHLYIANSSSGRVATIEPNKKR